MPERADIEAQRRRDERLQVVTMERPQYHGHLHVDTRTFYDRISTAYDLIADAGERTCRNQGLIALNASPRERVLEVGFGTGHALASLSSAVGSTGQVCGVDISSGMLAVARRTVVGSGAGRVSFALDDARSLCFRDAVFDAAFMSFTLELFESADIPVVLAEIRRVLRPAGRVVVVAMAEAERPTTITDVYQWLHRHFPHFVDCRPINVIEVLERAAFRTTRTDMMSIWGLPVASVVAFKR
jgi:ubiquinone/menaquinone biosynthesis C-methylase UbiE